MIHKHSVLLIFLALFVPALPAEAASWNQADYVRKVLQASPELETARQDLDRARRRKTSTLATAWLPNAAASASAIPYGHNPQNQYAFAKWKTESDEVSYNANVSLNLFNSFKDHWAFKTAALETRLADVELLRAVRETVLKALETFHHLILKNKNLAAFEQNLQMQRDQHEMAQNLYKQGLRSLFDIQKTQVDLYSTEQRLLGVRNDARLALAKFNWLIERPGEEAAQAQEPDRPKPGSIPGFDDSWSLALRQKPELINARLRVDKARIETRVRGQKLFPDLNVKADWNWQNSATFGLPSKQFGIPEKNYQVSAVLSYSFGLGHIAQWQDYMGAAAQHKAAQAAERETQRRIKEEILTAILELERLGASYAISARKESLVKENAAYVQERYSQGSAGILELTQAQQDLLSAQLEQAQVIKDYHLAVMKYKIAVGTPLDEEALE